MRIATAVIIASFTASSLATLPPPTEEAKAQAAVAAAKSAWTDKVAQYQLCRAMDRTAERYRNSPVAAAKNVPPPVPTPPCVDPGPYVPPVAASQAAARSRGRAFAPCDGRRAPQHERHGRRS